MRASYASCEGAVQVFLAIFGGMCLAIAVCVIFDAWMNVNSVNNWIRCAGAVCKEYSAGGAVVREYIDTRPVGPFFTTLLAFGVIAMALWIGNPIRWMSAPAPPAPAPPVPVISDSDYEDSDPEQEDDDAPLPPHVAGVLKAPERMRKGKAQCVVCMNYAATICLVPCGHHQLCDACVPRLWQAVAPGALWQCPTCRSSIDSVVRPIY